MVTCFTFSVYAQHIPKAVRDDNQAIRSLTKRVDKIGWLYYKNGMKLTHNSLINDKKEAFGLTVNDIVAIDKEQTDEFGGQHIRLKQYYKGIKVEGANYVLHYDSKGYLTHSNGELGEQIDNNTDVVPTITESKALELAVNALNGLQPLWLDPTWEQRIRIEKQDSSATYKPKAELLLVPTNNGKYALAYVFNVSTIAPLEGWKIYIDAKNKQLIKKISNMQKCTPVAISFTSLFNGVQGVLGRRAGWFSNWIGLENCNNEVNNETREIISSTNTNAVVNNSSSWGTYKQQFTSAHWAVDQSWNYFKEKFNRSGLNGNHEKLTTFVDPSTAYSRIAAFGLVNDDPALLIDKNIMSLDITGHEFTHGINFRTANLNGFGESGALNESFSDIFGVMIQRYATGVTNWQIGEEVPWNSGGLNGRLVRDLQTPANSCCNGGIIDQRPCAAIVGDANWLDPTAGFDDGGVHHNCGVQNKWFNLLSVGGPPHNGVTVQGIGIDKAAGITYANLTTQLTNNSTFQAAANGAVAIAESYYGCSSFELEQTRRAWQAVGVNTPQPPLTLNGNTNVCSDNYDTNINFDACWRFGTNYTWTFPSQFTGVLYGTGNNILSLNIPANTQGDYSVTVTGNFNGTISNQTLWFFVTNCNNYYSVKKNNNLSQITQFTLSPNPTSDFINILFPNEVSNGLFDAELYNSLGQLVYSKRITNVDSKLDIAQLPKGFYNIVLKKPSDKKIVFTNKLTKM